MSKSLPRIFLDADLSGARISLDQDSAHYVSHVLRLEPGGAVVVFDGRGTERVAMIESLSRREPALALGESRAPLPESPADITLIQGLVRGDRMDTIVQKATELGVSRVCAVRTKFSVVKLQGDRATRKLEHWRRVALSACEQSQRHFPPVIDLYRSLDDALHALPPGTVTVVLDADGERTVSGVDPSGHAIAVLVGPEGGLSPPETESLARLGCRRVRLGPRTLRAETAAIVACSTAQLLWGDLV